MSIGTLQALVQRCAEQLEPVEQQIKAALSQADVLHQDETGLYVEGHRSWLHVSSTEQLTRLSCPSQTRQGGVGRHWHPGGLPQRECA